MIACLLCGVRYSFIGPYRPPVLYDGKTCRGHFWGEMREQPSWAPSIIELLKKAV